MTPAPLIKVAAKEGWNKINDRRKSVPYMFCIPRLPNPHLQRVGLDPSIERAAARAIEERQRIRQSQNCFCVLLISRARMVRVNQIACVQLSGSTLAFWAPVARSRPP